MPETIYHNHYFVKRMRNDTIFVIVLFTMALSSYIWNYLYPAYSTPGFIYPICFSIICIIELFIYHDVVYQINVDGVTCKFISRKRTVVLAIADIESLLNNISFHTLRLKHKDGSLLIYGVLMTYAPPFKDIPDFRIPFRNFMRPILFDNEKLLIPFIQYVTERNPDFKIIYMNDIE
ncbi:MAG: hypothetical protein WCO98_02925, partial [bacterium]